MVLRNAIAGAYPYTGSSMDQRVSVGFSTHILIAVDVGAGIQLAIGALQSMVISEGRQIKRVGETGTMGFVDIHPDSNSSIDIDATRIVFDAATITQSFGRGYKHIGSQRLPFNVYVIDRTHSTKLGVGDINTGTLLGGFVRPPITQIYHNCWFTSKTSTYLASTYQIVEQAHLACQYVEDVFGTRHGDTERPIEYIGDSIEQAMDEGLPFGALPSADPLSNEGRSPISDKSFPFPFNVSIFPNRGGDERIDLGLATATDTLHGFKETFRSFRKGKTNPLSSGANSLGGVRGNNVSDIARKIIK